MIGAVNHVINIATTGPDKYITILEMDRSGELWYRIGWAEGVHIEMRHDDEIGRLVIVGDAQADALEMEEIIDSAITAWQNGFLSS